MRAPRKTKSANLPKRSFPVRLSADLHRAVVRQAAVEDRPLSQLVRAALREYLEARAS